MNPDPSPGPRARTLLRIAAASTMLLAGLSAAAVQADDSRDDQPFQAGGVASDGPIHAPGDAKDFAPERNNGNPKKVKVAIEGNTLTVRGSEDNEVIVLRLQAGNPNSLEVDIRNDGQADFSFQRNTFNTILVQAGDGYDTIFIDDTNGVFTDTEITSIYGDAGDDRIVAGAGSETLFGGSGNDEIDGGAGPDLILGGAGNDILFGGDGDDNVFGEADNDRMIWNPGDDTDLNEGGDGVDTVEVNGGNGAEVFTTTANGTRVRFDRLNPAPFFLDIGTTENLVLNANGGDDSSSATGNLAALIKTTVDGGAGNDAILGSNGIDLLLGGDGDDFIDGQQGNDTAFGGPGEDVFQWDPGDGSDTLEGDDGNDELLFNGSAGAEIFSVFANGPQARLTRNLGNIVMDLSDIEDVTINALGNTDSITVSDLSGTGVTAVNINFAGTIGGSTGDGAADTITINGTNGDDTVDIIGAGTAAAVMGLSPTVNISNLEGANDSLVVNVLGGDDGVTASTLPAGILKLTVDGAANDDTLLGSQGADILLGGDGADFLFGDNGNDIAFMGAGDDVFQWDPGDGNDTVEGQAGTDKMLFVGSNADENIDIVANGGRVLFFRNVANVTMDLDDVERIEFRALGGTDNMVVGDLTGTDITHIDFDLGGANGSGDAAADNVTVNGTNGDDTFGAAGNAAGVNVFGLKAAVAIIDQEHANDRLTLNALGGTDVVNASAVEADGIPLTINGGLGADLFIGSEGNDTMIGGDGNDTALMGAGDDTFTWNPGDDNDTIEGQDGVDRLLFNGANVAEIINVSPNGGRVIFTRNIAAVVMDLNDVEDVTYNALGGADAVVVGDLSGTDVIEVNVNLAASNGAGDGAADTVTVTGTNGDDVILVVGDASGTSVLGLAAQVNITGAESANDRVVVNALAGDDTVEASGLAATGMMLTADGGNDDDILVGGAGNDVLLGGAGDDVLLGGPGIDVLDGGTGNNVIIQG